MSDTAQPDYGADFWRDRTRVQLQPIAAPSILGLYGFAAATFIVAGHLANWYGDAQTTLYLFPFAAAFGGLAQLLAGMWAYRARDALATAMHGTWGSFWLGFGLLYLMFAVGALTEPTGAFPALGFWFITLAAITVMGAFAATAENVALASVLFTLAGGAALLAFAELTGSGLITVIGGWVLAISAVLAWYTASAMMLEETTGRVVLPLGKPSKAANIPGQRTGWPIEYSSGQPGVKVGQ